MPDWHDIPPSARLRALAMQPAIAASAGQPVPTLTEVCAAIQKIVPDVAALERMKACTCKGARADE